MQTMGMNAYLYAPKDDLKHRMSWREPYSEKEEDHMRSLIAAANEHNVLFIFAISPGNDVVYSDESDANILKERLEQVRLHSFCLLHSGFSLRTQLGDGLLLSWS